MKRKRLLLAVALVTGMLGWNSAQAQTDVTNTYIKNAGFEGDYVRFLDINTDRGVEKPNGWSVEWYQDNNDKNGMTFNATSITQDSKTWNAKSGNAYFARMRWANSTIYLRQTLSNLRPGNYTLAFSAATHTGAAGKNSLTISVAGQNQTIAAEDNANGDWTDYTINFSITSATPYATIEVKGVREDGLFKFGIDEFTLTYDGSSYYETILSNAQALLDNNADWAVDTNNALSTAISSNSGKTTVDEMNAAIIALEEAMATYKANNSTDVTNYITNATFDSNIDGWTCTGGDGNNFQRNSSANANFNGGFLEKWRNAWTGAYNQKNFDVSQNLTKLPNGEYTIKAAIIAVMQGSKETLSDSYKNKKHGGPYYIDDDHGVWLYGTSGDNTGKAWANTKNGDFEGGGGEFKTATVTVTNGNLTIGFKGVGSPNGGTELGTYANWIACDNWTLSYFGFDPTVLKANLQALQEEATELLANATYSNISGAERKSLATLSTATPEETKSALETAIRNIQDAIAAYTAAKPNYDALVAEIDKATALGADTSAAEAIAASETTTAADALAATQNLKVTEYEFVTSNYSYSVTLSDTWNSTGTNTKAATFNNEHWSGTTHEYKNQDDSNGQGWNAQSWSIDFNQDVTLPAGNYVFKVAGRKASGDNTEMALVVKNGTDELGTVNDFPGGNAARGINKDGVTSFDENDAVGFANNNIGYGWEWRYVKFTLSEDATVNIGIHAEGHDYHQWVSFGDYTLQTDNDANIALIAYNIALQAAQNTIDDETYVAVVGEERTTLQSAIAADATLDKSDKDAIDAATTRLNEATDAFKKALSSYQDLAAALDEPNAFVPAELPYASSEKYTAIQTAITNAANPSSADDAATKAENIRKAYRTYIESNALAEGVEGATVIEISDPNMDVEYDGTNHKFGAWQVFGQTDGTIQLLSNESFTDGSGKNDYKYADIYKKDNNAGIQQTINLEPGRYLLTVTARANTTSGAGFRLFAGDNTAEISRIGNSGGVFSRGWNDTSLEFEITKSSDINIGVQSYNGKDLWWSATRFRLVKIDDIEFVDVTVTEGGALNEKFYATYSNAEKALDFSAVEGLKAYYVTSASTSALTITEASKVPANTAVLIEGAEAKTYQVPVVTSGTDDASNNRLLVSNGNVLGDGQTIYVLGNGKNGVGFYLKKKDYAIAAGKAYLEIEDDGTGETKSFISLSGDDATAISNVEAAQGTGIIYNLNGQRVAAPVKGGLYIMNGKKVLVK